MQHGRHAKPTKRSFLEPTGQGWRLVVGPTVGRWPTSGPHHWPPHLARKLPDGSIWSCHVFKLLQHRFSCSGGPFDPCDDTCRAPIHRTFVPWIMTCHLASFLAQIHLHTITNQHLWNSLVFNPMLPFIPPLCMVFMPELTVKMGRIRPSTVEYDDDEY